MVEKALIAKDLDPEKLKEDLTKHLPEGGKKRKRDKRNSRNF
jgi:hypothetical protein